MKTEPEPADTKRNVTVIGAGIIGLAIGLKLALGGARVTIFDRDAPAAGCSAGNAGYFSQSGIFPVASWETLFDLPKLLLRPSGPLVIRPSGLPGLTQWGVRLLANASAKGRTDEITTALAALIRRWRTDYEPLIEAARAQDLLSYRGGLHLYRSENALLKAAQRIAVFASHGIKLRRVDAGELYHMEPHLAPGLSGALYFPDNASCLDPRGLGERFARAIASHGGQFERREVRAIRPTQAGNWELETDLGVRPANTVIVAAGRWSDELLEPLGYVIPLESERGYHLMLPQPEVELSRSIVAVESGIAITPMAGGLRLAGTVEFARRGTPMNLARADMMFGQCAPLLPGLSMAGASRWMGERPTLPDSLPAIGKSCRFRNLFYAFGHQHCGLTLAGATAALVSELVEGRTTSLDPEPYRLDRFSWNPLKVRRLPPSGTNQAARIIE